MKKVFTHEKHMVKFDLYVQSLEVSIINLGALHQGRDSIILDRAGLLI